MMMLIDSRIVAALITALCTCLLYIIIPKKKSEQKRIKHKNLDYNLAKELTKENWIRDKIHDYRMELNTATDFSYVNDDFDVDIEKHCGSFEERELAEIDYKDSFQVKTPILGLNLIIDRDLYL